MAIIQLYQSWGIGNNVSTREFRCNINSEPRQLVSIERSPGRKPLRGGGQGRRGRDPLGRFEGGRRAGSGYAGPPFTFVSGTPASSRAGDPARGPELVTHPSLANFPVNKFPRAVRANWPRSPESGRDKAVPRLPSSVGAPEAGGFHTSRAATARDRAGCAQAPVPPQTPTPKAVPAGPAPRGPSGPASQAVPAPRPRPRPLGPPRAAPRPHHNPRAGPGAPRLQATRRTSPRLPQCPRLLLRLLPRLEDGACRRDSRRRGISAASAACEEQRPARAPPSRPPVPSSPLCPPSAAGLTPRPSPPAHHAPPTPPTEAGKGPARGAARAAVSAASGVFWYGGSAGTRFVVLTTICQMRISRSDLLLL
ncbi:basic salivary proline-rich protein 3-like [Panthera tigris]|uniref:basic salivary proline-rich protein 3-like n=1 Tax=Panthera tigris TaxID=9694 RepID=UPI001C6FB4D1|nr:basic salivary proline-rich protein 3-like [Panthera tigris]